MEKQYYTTTELADLARGRGLDLTPTRIRQLCAAGEIKAERPGRDWLIASWEAERWIKARLNGGE